MSDYDDGDYRRRRRLIPFDQRRFRLDDDDDNHDPIDDLDYDFDDYDLDEVSPGFVRLVTFWQISLFPFLPGKVSCFL